METREGNSVGQIVAENYNAADVFEKYHIDYYNAGRDIVKDACKTAGVDAGDVLKEIAEKGAAANDDIAYNSWELNVLADYIVRVHHKYAERQIQIIKPKLEELSAGEQEKHHPELTEIKSLFGQAAGAIAAHQKKEELILFPFIRKMADAKKNNKPFVRPPLTKSAENPVNMLTHEHHQQAEAFKKISQLTRGYAVPADTDEDYEELLTLLKEFELNLHKHLHLENNILFPKALQMDKEMTA